MHGNDLASGADGRDRSGAVGQQHGADDAFVRHGGSGGDDGQFYGDGRDGDCESGGDRHGIAERKFENGVGNGDAAAAGDGHGYDLHADFGRLGW